MSGSLTPNPKKRGYLLPKGCKDLIDLLRPPRASAPKVRINDKIPLGDIRLIDQQGYQVGIMSVSEALRLARSRGLDLIEITPTATPPVCRLIDYGQWRYELAKRRKKKP